MAQFALMLYQARRRDGRVHGPSFELPHAPTLPPQLALRRSSESALLPPSSSLAAARLSYPGPLGPDAQRPLSDTTAAAAVAFSRDAPGASPTPAAARSPTSPATPDTAEQAARPATPLDEGSSPHTQLPARRRAHSPPPPASQQAPVSAYDAAEMLLAAAFCAFFVPLALASACQRAVRARWVGGLSVAESRWRLSAQRGAAAARAAHAEGEGGLVFLAAAAVEFAALAVGWRGAA